MKKIWCKYILFAGSFLFQTINLSASAIRTAPQLTWRYIKSPRVSPAKPFNKRAFGTISFAERASSYQSRFQKGPKSSRDGGGYGRAGNVAAVSPYVVGGGLFGLGLYLNKKKNVAAAKRQKEILRQQWEASYKEQQEKKQAEQVSQRCEEFFEVTSRKKKEQEMCEAYHAEQEQKMAEERLRKQKEAQERIKKIEEGDRLRDEEAVRIAESYKIERARNSWWPSWYKWNRFKSYIGSWNPWRK